jgi:hypothetical protein
LPSGTCCLPCWLTWRSRQRSKPKPGSVLNSCEDPHRLWRPWHSCLAGDWRSVGSPPPDAAVWGRPPYELPVWRSVIINTTERILAGSVRRPTPAICFLTTSGVVRGMYALATFLPSDLTSSWQSPERDLDYSKCFHGRPRGRSSHSQTCRGGDSRNVKICRPQLSSEQAYRGSGGSSFFTDRVPRKRRGPLWHRQRSPLALHKASVCLGPPAHV